MGLFVRRKSRVARMDGGVWSTKGKVEHWYSSTLCLGIKDTRKSVNKFLRSHFGWHGRGALQCDAEWEKIGYQTISPCLKLSHSRNLALKYLSFLLINIRNTYGVGVQLLSLFYSTNFCWELPTCLLSSWPGTMVVERELSMSIEICSIGLDRGYEGKPECWISLPDSHTQ